MSVPRLFFVIAAHDEDSLTYRFGLFVQMKYDTSSGNDAHPVFVFITMLLLFAFHSVHTPTSHFTAALPPFNLNTNSLVTTNLYIASDSLPVSKVSTGL